MEKKYYEALAVIDMLTKLFNEPEHLHKGETFYAGVCAAEDALTELPTVELAEVHHGKWVDWCGSYVCTNCNFECGDHNYLGDGSYCPECGAKMDAVSV